MGQNLFIQMQQIEKIFKYCAYQDRSVYETRLKIKSLKMDTLDEERLIERLISEKYLDDNRFARHYVQGKLNAKGWGIVKIKMGLVQKGINPSIINEVLQSIDKTQYEDNLKKEVEKWTRIHPLNHTNKPKLIRFLLSKGYSYDQITQIIDIE